MCAQWSLAYVKKCLVPAGYSGESASGLLTHRARGRVVTATDVAVTVTVAAAETAAAAATVSLPVSIVRVTRHWH